MAGPLEPGDRGAAADGRRARCGCRPSPADRGDILGAGGKGLVIERRVERIGIDKSRIKAAEADGSAKALARLVDIDVDRYAKAVKAAGPQAFVVALVVRADSDDTLSDAEIASIPGAVQLGTELPLAPTKAFGQPLLGVVGEATAEVIAKSKGSVTAGDLVGLTGLEQRYDSQLRGAPGVTVEAVAGSSPASCSPVGAARRQVAAHVDRPRAAGLGRQDPRRRQAGQRDRRDPPVVGQDRGARQRPGWQGRRHGSERVTTRRARRSSWSPR